jgi:hypothetical protein
MITFSDFACDWRCFPEESYDLNDLDIAHVMAIVKPKAGRVGSPEDILQLLKREFVCWSLPPHVERLVGQLWQAYESDAALYERIASGSRKDGPMLEEEIKKLRIAIEDLNETLKKGGGAPAASRKDDKPATSRKEDKPPAARKGDDKDGKGMGPTFDEFKKACAEFTSADLDDKEFEYRVTRVLKPIFEKYDVKKASELPEDSWQETLDAIDDFYAEEDERRRREEEDDRGSSRGRSSRDDDRGSSGRSSREDDDRGSSRSRSSREDDDRGSSRGRSSGGSRSRSTRG